MSLAKEFREFILRGNVVDLAVGVVIGASFGAVVKAFTNDVITPLIGMAGKSNLGDVVFTVHGAKFPVGDLLNNIVTFLLTAFVVFFFVVKPVNILMSLKKAEPPAEETTMECPRCLSKIPIKATRCAFCTSDVAPAS